MSKKTKKSIVPNQPMYAPNDPRRIPVAHRELVNKIFRSLKENGYNIFDAQVITQAVSVLGRTTDLKKGLKVVTEIVKAVDSVKDAHRDIEAILQILGMQLTSSLNNLKLEDVTFEEISIA